MSNAPRRAGRHFLQIPGPTPVPDRILRAMDMPVIDHRGPEFKALGLKVLAGIKTIFKTVEPGVHLSLLRHRRVGGGAGQHALARRQGADVRDRALRHAVEEHGRPSSACSRSSSPPTGAAAPTPRPSRRGCARTRGTPSRPCASCTTRPPPAPPRASTRCAAPSMRRGIPALLMVDTISSLASIDYRHDEWGVDVTVGGSQKGLMLPPGLGFNAVSDKALAAAKTGEAAQVLFLLGGDAARQQGGLLPLHARHQPALRPGRGHRHAARGGPRPRLRPPRPPRRRRAPRGRGPGASRSGARTRSTTPPR